MNARKLQQVSKIVSQLLINSSAKTETFTTQDGSVFKSFTGKHTVQAEITGAQFSLLTEFWLEHLTYIPPKMRCGKCKGCSLERTCVRRRGV